MRWSYTDLLSVPDPVVDVILKVMTEEFEERQKEQRDRDRKNAARRSRGR